MFEHLIATQYTVQRYGSSHCYPFLCFTNQLRSFFFIVSLTWTMIHFPWWWYMCFAVAGNSFSNMLIWLVIYLEVGENIYSSDRQRGKERKRESKSQQNSFHPKRWFQRTEDEKRWDVDKKKAHIQTVSRNPFYWKQKHKNEQSSRACALCERRTRDTHLSFDWSKSISPNKQTNTRETNVNKMLKRVPSDKSK